MRSSHIQLLGSNLSRDMTQQLSKNDYSKIECLLRCKDITPAYEEELIAMRDGKVKMELEALYSIGIDKLPLALGYCILENDHVA